MLAKIGTEKGIMVSGIKCDQTTADFSNQNLNPPDAILLASDLSQAVVTGALTRVDVRRNNIAGDGAAQLSDAVLGNLKIEMFNGIPIKEMRQLDHGAGPEGEARRSRGRHGRDRTHTRHGRADCPGFILQPAVRHLD